MALIVTFSNDFYGTVLLSGGGSGGLTGGYGASGTYYYEDSHRGLDYRKRKYRADLGRFDLVSSWYEVTLDNAAQSTHASIYTYVSDPVVSGATNQMFFNDLRLFRAARARFGPLAPVAGTSHNLTVIEVVGDRTATVNLRANQTMFLEMVDDTIEGYVSSLYSNAPSLFVVDVAATLVAPQTLEIRGVSSQLNGDLAGPEVLVMEEGGSLVLSTTARTASFVDGRVTAFSVRGRPLISVVVIEDQGALSCLG